MTRATVASVHTTQWTPISRVAPLLISIFTQSIVHDKRPLPSHHFDQAKDDAQFDDEPWVEPPVHIDYGTNLRLAPGVYINFNCTVLDTCVVTIGARTLVGPNVSFFSGTHPLDPAVRNGTAGPEDGAEIHVEEDVWIGGNVVILPGVRIGKGATVGAGSVVTKVCVSSRSDHPIGVANTSSIGCCTVQRRSR